MLTSALGESSFPLRKAEACPAGQRTPTKSHAGHESDVHLSDFKSNVINCAEEGGTKPRSQARWWQKRVSFSVKRCMSSWGNFPVIMLLQIEPWEG